MSIGKITDDVKTLLAKGTRNEVKDVSNENTYYIFVGYTDSEQYPFADSDLSEATSDSDLVQIYRNIVTMHRVLPGGVSRVVLRRNWVKNTQYRGWYNGATQAVPYYVLSTEIVRGIVRQNVYKCLFAPDTPSTIAPNGTSPESFKTSDGYWWQYLYTISNSEAILFLNNVYMPVPEIVKKADEEFVTTGTSRYDQLQVQNASIAGSVFNIRIDSDQTDSELKYFTSKTSITIKAKDGYGKTHTRDFIATATREHDSDSNWKFQVTQYGAGFTALPYAYDADDDSDNAKINAFKLELSSGNGHGAEAADELLAQSVMLTSRAIPESGDFKSLAQNDYAMIGLIKDPIDSNTNKIATQDFYVVCEKIICDNQALFSEDSEIVKSGDTNTRGRVVAVDGKTVYYVKSGLLRKNFSDSDSILQGDSVTNTITTRIPPEINFNSGHFMTVDYLSTSLTRSPDQIESLNIILNM